MELVLIAREAAYVWSLRIDAWATVVSAEWHSIESLRSLAAIAIDMPQQVALTHDVSVATDGPYAVVTVTSASGVRASARDDARGLSTTARSLLARADDERARSGRMPG